MKGQTNNPCDRFIDLLKFSYYCLKTYKNDMIIDVINKKGVYDSS